MMIFGVMDEKTLFEFHLKISMSGKQKSLWNELNMVIEILKRKSKRIFQQINEMLSTPIPFHQYTLADT